MTALPRDPVPCPNCGTLIVLDLCSKDWCPRCGQRFCCADNACLDRLSDDLWEAHQAVLIEKLKHVETAEETAE
jgi:hypothetical protein